MIVLPEALLVTLSVALADPVVVGLNVIVNETLDPAEIVTGSEIPPTLNTPESLLVIEVTVTLAPLATKLPEAVPLVPTTTSPRFNVPGVTVRVPTEATPVPESEIVVVEVDAFEVIVTSPLALPADVGLKLTLKLVLPPALRVCGRLMPLTLKPLPLATTLEIVTLLPPVLVTVSDIDWVLPSVTLPKLKLGELALSAPGATPVPESAIVVVGVEASEVTVTSPLVLPGEVGLKLMLKLVLAPALRVFGRLMPETANSLPLTETSEIETLVPPVFVMVSESVWVLPSVTLPKLKLGELALSAPGATPVPETEIVVVDVEAFDVIVTLPLTVPAEDGLKLTLKLTLPPALTVAGKLMLLILKSLVLAEMSEIVTLVSPVLVIVSDKVCELPSVTLPKLKLEELALSVPGVTPVPDRARVLVEFEASLVTERVALKLPVLFGEN